MMKRKAFSLLELLVVLGVLGVLISMVTMGYPRVVGIARQVACKANLRSLSVMLRTSRESQREQRQWQSGRPPFVKMYKWPGTVAAESGMMHGGEVFICPSTEVGGDSGLEMPPLLYRTAHRHRPFLPYDPTHFSCVMRKGIDEDGQPYTEYCIEDNLDVKAEFEYAMGHVEFSKNDGIWRIFDRPIGGRKKVELMYFTCTWDNSLYVDGEFYTDLYGSTVGMTLYFDWATTSYAYNADLEDDFTVGDDTIVLIDYPEAYVDATESEIYAGLASPESSRHLGKHNVLHASGSAETVGTTSLYPDIDMGQWTSDPTD